MFDDPIPTTLHDDNGDLVAVIDYLPKSKNDGEKTFRVPITRTEAELLAKHYLAELDFISTPEEEGGMYIPRVRWESNARLHVLLRYEALSQARLEELGDQVRKRSERARRMSP